MHDRTGSIAPAPRLRRTDVTSGDLLALEWRRLRRDAVFWIAVAASCLAVWYGLANGAGWMRFQEQAIARASAIAEEGLAEAKAEAQRRGALSGQEIGIFDDPRSAIGFESRFLRLHDCLAPTPLAMVAVGQSDLFPYCVAVKTGPLSFFAASYEWENPLRLLLGRFDSAFAIITILPLLVLVASFDLLAREKEMGTLPLLMSFPIALSRFLAMRFLLRAAIFIGGVLAAMLLGLALVGFDASAPAALPRTRAALKIGTLRARNMQVP